MIHEDTLKGALLLEAPKRMSNLRLFIRHVSGVRIDDRFVRFSIPGQADLYGLVKGGRHIEIELKALGGVLSKNQKAWQTFCKMWNVPHVVLAPWHDETLEETVARWCDEIYILLR